MGNKLGYLSAWGFVVTTVVSLLYVEIIISTYPDKFLVMFFAISLATLFFNLLNIKSFKRVYQGIFINFKLYLIMSCYIAINWSCSIFGVILSNTFIYNLYYFLFAAAISYFFLYWVNTQYRYLIVCLCSLIILIIGYIINMHYVYGIIIGLIGGLTAFCYRKTSQLFAKTSDFTSTQILMTRFYPFLIFLAFKANWHNISELSPIHWSHIAMFTVLSLILPIFLNQYSVLKIGTEKATIISAFIFPLSWIGQTLVSHSANYSRANLVIAITACLIIITPYIRLAKK